MPFTAASEIVLSTFFATSLAESTTDLRTAGDVLKSLAWRVKDVRSIDTHSLIGILIVLAMGLHELKKPTATAQELPDYFGGYLLYRDGHGVSSLDC
jgi:hypothetical protein